MTDESSSQINQVTEKSATPPAGPAEPPRDRVIPAWLWSGVLVVVTLGLLLGFARG